MPNGAADWAATTPWAGLQNVPPTIAALAETEPVSGKVFIPLPKLTAPGANGSLTFTNGVLTAYTKPT